MIKSCQIAPQHNKNKEMRRATKNKRLSPSSIAKQHNKNKEMRRATKNKRLSPSSIANKQISTRRKRTRCENAPKEGKVRACDNQPLLGYFVLEWFKVFYFLNKWKESIALKTENNTKWTQI
jgi:hypothetical protein